jgi:Desulfoferrodoxin, N-terminal domain
MEAIMDEKCIFNCEVCGNTVEAKKTVASLKCCGQPMKKAEPLEPCKASETAEHTRLDHSGDPCDDGRGMAG